MTNRHPKAIFPYSKANLTVDFSDYTFELLKLVWRNNYDVAKPNIKFQIVLLYIILIAAISNLKKVE